MLGFNDAVEIILSHEGGYVNDPKDPGGETNYGISGRAYPDIDIKNLTREEAKEIYRRDYWQRMKCPSLPFSVALVLFDFGVNAGPRQAVKCLQRAALTKDDGIIGPLTIAAVLCQHKNLIVERMTLERIMYYSRLPTWDRFGKGWTRRSIETMSAALLMRDMV